MIQNYDNNKNANAGRTCKNNATAMESPPNILMANYDQQGFSLNDQVDYQIGLNKIDKRSSDNFMDYPAGADLQSVPHQTKNKQIKKR